MAGYSGTLLPRKLGIKAGDRLALVAAPSDFDATLGTLPEAVTVRRQLRGPVNVAVFFTKRRADLERRFEALSTAIEVDGGLWVAWPKRASGVATDVTEDTVREVALPAGLVDNKVCAIDETWSGLRVVWRREGREAERRDAPRRPRAGSGADVFYVSILTSDRERDPELFATIWYGKQPSTLKLHQAFNLAGNKRVFVWEGESAADLQFMDLFNYIGEMETFPAFDRTENWRQGFAGDLEGFRANFEATGRPQAEVEAGIELCRAGLEASSHWEARQAAREWVAEQEGVLEEDGE